MPRAKIAAVGVVPNFAKRRCRSVFGELVSWLDARRRSVCVRAGLEGSLPAGVRRVPEERFGQTIDLLVVLGGDGTLLSAARLVYPTEVPILGVNLGGLGFLADVRVRDLYAAMEATLGGQYRIERRMMLEIAVLGRNGRPRAKRHGLNDAVVHEAGHRLIELRVEIGASQVGMFKADGVIVASPTGSTAYSLSAGGPILEPKLNALVAVPICPHMLAVRPLIFPASESILITPRGGNGVYLAVDGQEFMDLAAGESVRVRRAPRTACFVQLGQRSFYELLREKMKWGA
ncbi:MAG: NAD(+) kinase [Candidatus Eisenbacteria bacterium]|nr:NAD(+) kinase [Candidatus Eisenbacteria bacterium]